jgi:hypothetical protein
MTIVPLDDNLTPEAAKLSDGGRRKLPISRLFFVAPVNKMFASV